MSRYAMTDLISEAMDVYLNEAHPNISLLCPFHHERNKSFSINLETGLWVCFACNERGNYEKLCRLLSAPIDGEYRIKRALQDAFREPVERRNFSALANHLHRNIEEEGSSRKLVEDFLHSRRISPQAIDGFTLGFDEERRAISFPYPDIEGVVRGIKYRSVHDGSKSAESGSDFTLYHPEFSVGRDVIYVFEGESDTLVGWSQLAPSMGVVGTSGASVSDAQWERNALTFLFSRRIYLCYDADKAGDDCAESAMRVLGDKCVRLRPTRGKDISDHILAGGTIQELIDE
jgi:DNA primase